MSMERVKSVALPASKAVTLTPQGWLSRDADTSMGACNKHPNHDHRHGSGCGHTAIEHDGHIDYLHDGHLHHMYGDHVDYLVDGHLHHPHGNHCDDHGPVPLKG